MENLVIIGSGPAAHTAAIYAGRAKLNPLMYEGFLASGVAAGGQLTITTDVENYPGFPEGIMGPELMERMRRQSLKCGARIETLTIEKVDLSRWPFKVFAGTSTVETKVLVIATGATAKRMFVPGEERLWQKGISACAVCDGALPIFRNKNLVVVGGGDSAVEEATYLTKFASKVTLLVRRDVLRASKVMQERILSNSKIEILWNTVLLEVVGDSQLTAVKIKNIIDVRTNNATLSKKKDVKILTTSRGITSTEVSKTNQESVLEAGGLFYAIGHVPNTAFLTGQVELDDVGYIKTKPGTTQTNINGVFACGDVQDKIYRQAVTAAGSGCMAALDAERFLREG